MEKKKIKQNKVKSESYNVSSWLSTIVLILASLCVVIDCCWFYMTKVREVPTTYSAAYIEQIGKPEDGEVYFMEFNHFTNANKNGVELTELKFNYYADEKFTTLVQTGIQTIGTPQFLTEKRGNNGWWFFASESYFDYSLGGIDSKAFYYNQDADLAFKASKRVGIDDYFILNINGAPYQLKINPNGKVEEYGVILGGNYQMASPVQLFKTLLESVNTLNPGDYLIGFDLTKFFKISEFKNGQAVPIVADNEFKKIKVKVHIEKQGAVDYKQSIFNIIKNDPKYSTNNIPDDNKYWKAEATVLLTEKDLILRPSEFYNGNFASIKNGVVKFLENYSNIQINLEINLDNLNIKGLDMFGFSTLKINSLKLTSSKIKDFYFLENSLNNFDKSKLEVSKNITLHYVGENKMAEVA